eukprot:6576521-Prymnesium_polylepis.1
MSTSTRCIRSAASQSPNRSHGTGEADADVAFTSRVRARWSRALPFPGGSSAGRTFARPASSTVSRERGVRPGRRARCWSDRVTGIALGLAEREAER